MTTRAQKIGIITGEFTGRYSGVLPVKSALELLAGDTYIENVVVVNNAAEFEAALLVQTAGQTIVMAPGTYTRTAATKVLLAADGGGISAPFGPVQILGLSTADACIEIDATLAAGTFEYTFAGNLELKGGANKIALKAYNGAGTEKTIIYFNDSAHAIDNGTGVAISYVNTGTGAIRLYVNGVGQGFDTINVTPKLADDRFLFNNVSFDETFTAGAAAVACYFNFIGCNLKRAGMAGGHATQVWSAIHCWSTASGIHALAASTDFTGITCDALLPAS
jgi:hypothetical protein